MRLHLSLVRHRHRDALADGFGSVYLPDALERKYPGASREWFWQYVFPSRRISRGPGSDLLRRHYAGRSALQKALRAAARWAHIDKHAYDWGGFDAVSHFSSQMDQGKQAGDIDTVNPPGVYGTESCSRGVDCSGFVSRALGLTKPYITSNISLITK